MVHYYFTSSCVLYDYNKQCNNTDVSITDYSWLTSNGPILAIDLCLMKNNTDIISRVLPMCPIMMHCIIISKWNKKILATARGRTISKGGYFFEFGTFL